MKSLRKTVVIANQRVELFSIDGECWSSNLAQLEERMKEREREQKRILSEAKRYLKGRAACLKNRRYENWLACFENRVRAYTVQPHRRGKWYACQHDAESRSRRWTVDLRTSISNGFGRTSATSSSIFSPEMTER
jgi:hypothetical protein